MARFSGNPLKNPLTGNEYIPATDPSTGNDISFTPLIITQFVAQNMQLAAGSSNGLIDPGSYAKLLALDTQAATNIRVAQLAEVSIPTFFSGPANGGFAIYQHVLDVPWALSFAYLVCSAGSTNVTVSIGGVAVAGMTNIPCTPVSGTFLVAGGSSNYTLYQTNSLTITFSGTTGNCANVALSIRANATISP
jgi:hypothetical protein